MAHFLSLKFTYKLSSELAYKRNQYVENFCLAGCGGQRDWTDSFNWAFEYLKISCCRYKLLCVSDAATSCAPARPVEAKHIVQGKTSLILLPHENALANFQLSGWSSGQEVKINIQHTRTHT